MFKFIVFISCFALCLIINFNSSFAASVDNQSDNNSLNSIDDSELNKLEKKTELNNLSDVDIFGDEQTFPFVAGLGKNAAH